LFPDISYFYESGGIPENITDLSYEEFKGVPRIVLSSVKFIHFSLWRYPLSKDLKFLNEKYLSEFQRMPVHSEIARAAAVERQRIHQKLKRPRRPEDDGYATVALSWIFGPSVDPVVSLMGSVVYHYLLGTESSPLSGRSSTAMYGEDLDE